MATHIWLRAETKPLEERTALTPEFAKLLLDKGFDITVEQCEQRAIAIEEYEKVGCQLSASHAWKTQAPEDAIILGLKELEESEAKLTHNHIHFAHVYKEQTGWQQFLNRFSGKGTLFDLEYLVDDNERRVAAFGYWAGFAGAATALLAWSEKKQGKTLSSLSAYPNKNKLVEDVSAQITATGAQKPKVLVIGAKGRSGKGAVELIEAVGADVIAWDIEETKIGGPFPEILDADVLVNCVFIQKKIPPFVTKEMLKQPKQLSVICDVSCDPYGDYNPLPIYNKCTTFSDPVLKVGSDERSIDLISIDHLPSMLPVESSEDYCQQLFPHLATLDDLSQGVWQKAKIIFDQKVKLAKK